MLRSSALHAIAFSLVLLSSTLSLQEKSYDQACLPASIQSRPGNLHSLLVVLLQSRPSLVQNYMLDMMSAWPRLEYHQVIFSLSADASEYD